MNRHLSFILMLIGSLTAARSGAAVVTNTPPAAQPAPAKADNKMDFQSFRIITERNIFDMSRSGRVRGTRAAPPVRVDNFALIGTMSYEKGQFAFFDGSSSEYQRTLKVGESIAGYKITAIGSDNVELQSSTNQPVRMVMGTEMQRRDRGPWSLGARSEPVIASTEPGSSEARGTGSTLQTQAEQNAAAHEQRGGGSEDEVMKRLMEKRAKALLKKGDR